MGHDGRMLDEALDAAQVLGQREELASLQEAGGAIDAIFGPDFRRVRIGIGHPGDKAKVTRYVLGNYAKAEIEPLSDLLGAIAAEAEWLADGDEVRFMSEVARRMQPD